MSNVAINSELAKLARRITESVVTGTQRQQAARFSLDSNMDTVVESEQNVAEPSTETSKTGRETETGDQVSLVVSVKKVTSPKTAQRGIIGG